MRFSVVAARADGTLLRGERQGIDEYAVAQALHGEGLVPVEVTQARPSTWSFAGRRPLVRITRPQELFGPLATLLEAGTPLADALEQLARLEGTAPAVSEQIERWCAGIRQGSSLADAMSNDASPPGALVLAMVRAGERAGTLASALARLADHLAETAAFRRSLVSALFYPAMLAFTALGTLFVIAQFVIPRFAVLFADTGVALPWATEWVLSIGVWFEAWGVVVPLGLAVGWIGVRAWMTTASGRLAAARLALLTPWVGTLVVGRDLSTLCRTLAMALRSGTPLPDGLALAADACGNASLGGVATRAVGEVRGGRALSEALASEGQFPRIATDLIRLGESSGRLADVLDQTAALHEDAVRTALRRALTVLEPAMIIVLGLVVGAVVLALLSAILDLNDLGQVALGGP